MTSTILNIFKSNWRTIVPVFLVIGLIFSILFFYQLYLPLLICSFIFSIVVFAIESRKISEIIKGNIFVWLLISVIYLIVYFLSKCYAIHYFNIKYDIFSEYLNYSVIALAGITGTIFFISLSCSFLFIYFLLQIYYQNELIKKATALIHSISCCLAIGLSSITYSTVDNNEIALLYLDAYTYSDCQTENKFAIRKDNETCYLFSNWKIEKIYQPKKP